MLGAVGPGKLSEQSQRAPSSNGTEMLNPYTEGQDVVLTKHTLRTRTFLFNNWPLIGPSGSSTPQSRKAAAAGITTCMLPHRALGHTTAEAAPSLDLASPPRCCPFLFPFSAVSKELSFRFKEAFLPTWHQNGGFHMPEPVKDSSSPPPDWASGGAGGGGGS